MKKPSKQFAYSALILIALAAVVLWKLSKIPATTYGKVNHSPKPPTVTLFFGGDIMLSRNVDAKMAAANDFGLPFEQIEDRIKSADVAFANLESPFNDKGPHFVDGSLTFDADPQAITGLTNAGFDVLSTANNHTLDDGQYGIDFTKILLSQNNILPVGTGTDCHKGQILTRANMTFGFLAYTYGTNTGPISKNICYATDLAQLAKDVEALKPKVDYLVVSTHMGVEYTRTPTEAQVNFAHAAVDAGADLVIGNHPHWVQPIEQYKGGWIFYAMGNLVFDQMWSTETTQGLTATITFENKAIKNITLAPIIIENYCCPRWADSSETKSILGEIDLTSTQLLPTIR